MKTKIILRTEHGSHLYGLARPQSDHDYYEIYDFLNRNWRPKKQASQNIEGDQDELRISLDRFEYLCYKGVPQCVEVLFAPAESWVVVDDSWPGIASHIKLQLPNHMPTILTTYRRTALNFFYSKKDRDKKRRHAFRLILNAGELKATGKMQARLRDDQIVLVNELTTSFYTEEKFKDMMYETF